MKKLKFNNLINCSYLERRIVFLIRSETQINCDDYILKFEFLICWLKNDFKTKYQGAYEKNLTQSIFLFLLYFINYIFLVYLSVLYTMKYLFI